MPRPLPEGIFRTYRNQKWTGYRAFIRVPYPGYPKGRLLAKRFAKTATDKVMEDWREDQRVDGRRRKFDRTAVVVALQGFAKDVVDYLEAVAAMPSFKDRARDMKAWIERFGDMPRALIKASMIRAARDTWLLRGPKMVYEEQPDGRHVWVPKVRPLSASAVNHRLRALENFFTVMNGAKGDNPVREVPEAPEPDAQPRDQPYPIVRAILEAMPDIARPLKGGTIEKGSLTKVRCEVMAWQGIRPAQLKRVKPAHLLWDLRVIEIQRSPKGPRQPMTAKSPKLVPMTAEGYKAFRRFDKLQAYGTFSKSSLYKSFQRAVAKVNDARVLKKLPPLPHVRPYDLRHTFLTHMADAAGKQAASEFGTHSKPEMADRYARAAIARRMAGSAKSFDRLVRRRR